MSKGAWYIQIIISLYICLCAYIYKERENDLSGGKMLTIGGAFVLFLNCFINLKLFPAKKL